MVKIDEQFNHAALQWDLEALYTDLASAKGKRLTPTEKLHLRGLLCGYSPSEIAEKLRKNVKGVETDLCATLYRYVKNLVNKMEERIENWRKITEYLEEAGYKIESFSQTKTPENLEKFNVTNITFQHNQITIDVFLKINIPMAEKSPLKTEDIIEKIIAEETIAEETIINGFNP